jgi:hypothetical protein
LWGYVLQSTSELFYQLSNSASVVDLEAPRRCKGLTALDHCPCSDRQYRDRLKKPLVRIGETEVRESGYD